MVWLTVGLIGGLTVGPIVGLTVSPTMTPAMS